MSTSAIAAIVTLSILIIFFIGYWIYLNSNTEDPIEKLIPSIKEYEPPPTLLYSKCPNCGARMTSNTCEYCDMTFYPEPNKPLDLISNTSPGYMRITQEGIFIEPYDITKVIEDRVENRFEPTILRMWFILYTKYGYKLTAEPFTIDFYKLKYILDDTVKEAIVAAESQNEAITILKNNFKYLGKEILVLT